MTPVAHLEEVVLIGTPGLTGVKKTYSQTTGTRAIFNENISSIRSAVSSPLEDNNKNNKKKKIKQTCLHI